MRYIACHVVKSIKEKNKVVKMDRESVRRRDDIIIHLYMDLVESHVQFEISELHPLEISHRLLEWESERQNRDLN